MPLLKAQCSKDTQMFLCSLFAPVCVDHQSIYPCRSLCESVKSNCLQKMLSYGYQWPEMFDCAKFPENNGLCMQAPNTQETTTTQTTTTTTELTSKPISTTKTIRNRIQPQMTCHGCSANQTISSMKNLVTTYCNSDLVIRARIPSVRSSRFDLAKQRATIKLNRTMSQFISLPRRDRKILKGFKLAMNSYLTERSLFSDSEDYVDEDDDGRSDNMDIFLLSNYHLNLANSLNKNNDMKRLKMRSLAGSSQCKCDKLKKNLRPKTRYLIFGKVLKFRKINLKPVDRLRLARHRRASFNETLPIKRRHMRQQQQQKLVKLVYLNGVYAWNSARAFVDYIEDDTIDKKMMCNDVDATANEINRVRQLLI